MTEDKRPVPVGRWRRRAVLLAAAAAGGGAWWAWPSIAPLFVGDFEFEPLPDLPGFRRIAMGESSPAPSPLIGMSRGDEADLGAAKATARADLCNALFGGPPPPGVVPIASFSDYNCPFCRVLTGRLAALQARSGSAVRITWHEWPLLGPTSVTAARAALAADMQGAYATFHKRLMRTRFVPTPSFLEVVARDIGIDPARLRADMESDAVSERLRSTDAVARIFGFIGTPALVVGRTVVVGAVSEAVIHALIEQERLDGPPPGCAA